MTLADLLCYIRQELLSLRANPNKDGLTMLSEAIGVVVGALEENQLYSNREVVKIIYDLYDSIRDSLIGTEWKSHIPSVEEIKAAFDN